MLSLVFRKKMIERIANKLLKKSSIMVNTNEFHSKQLITRYLMTSSQLLAIKGMPISMPSLSPTMERGSIVKWLKKEGQQISPGDVLCEVQTDKAIVGLELEEEGILAKIILPDDTKDINVGTLIAVMVEIGQDWKEVTIPDTSGSQSIEKSESKDDIKGVETSKSSHSLIGPSARNLLQQFGIASHLVKSSGPHNTLLKDDVLQYIKHKQLKPIDVSSVAIEKKPEISSIPKTVSQSSKYIDIELNNMRKTIAKRLTQSKTTIPHSYMSVNCLMSGVLNTRKKLKVSGVNVSVNDFIIKATAISLKKVPQINSLWIESTSSVQMVSDVDISIAVATPNGLITPIIKNANQLSLETISTTVKELAEKARNGKLQPNEFIGGSFSISNLGMFGIKDFCAVINPPQSAILAIGTSRLILNDNNEAQHVSTVTLSFDCRVIEEETAAKFLETFKNTIEDPIELQNSDGTENRRLNALIS